MQSSLGKLCQIIEGKPDIARLPDGTHRILAVGRNIRMLFGHLDTVLQRFILTSSGLNMGDRGQTWVIKDRQAQTLIAA